MTEEDYGELLNFERSDRFSERQKAALLYTSNLIWNPEAVDDALWARLKEHFTDEQIVELAGSIAMENYRARFNRVFGIESPHTYRP